jgi:flagellar hook-length control protein FliK
MEARTGFEPVNDGFADRSLTTWVPRLAGRKYAAPSPVVSRRGIWCGRRAGLESLPMAHRPEDAPLGAPPVLPPPAGRPAQLAATMFAKHMRERQAASTRAANKREETPSESGPGASARASAAGRHYDLALAIAGAPEAAGETSPCVEALPAAEPTLEPAPVTAADEATPARPPPGAPTIRPSARQRQPEAAAAAIPADLGGSMQVTSEADGATTFDLTLPDDLFENLHCQLTLRDHRLVATFRVADVNLRRLLEAEAGRLRARLEERGLKVAEIVVLEE